jgi:hypothetical protein
MGCRAVGNNTITDKDQLGLGLEGVEAPSHSPPVDDSYVLFVPSSLVAADMG